jgi:folate-dependent phosphoribosylglycinamide formyltransferase PurN
MLTSGRVEILALIYRFVPKAIRRIIYPAVQSGFFLIRKLASIISQIRLSAYKIHGIEKSSGCLLTVIFFGKERELHRLSDLLFSDLKTKEFLRKILFWNVMPYYRSNNFKADLIFINCDNFFSSFLARYGFLLIPEWISFKLNLFKTDSKSWKSKKSKSLKDDLRKIRQQKYSYEITRDPKKFEYFFQQMYLPYIQKRFRESTVFLTRFNLMKLIFEKGTLLLVKRGNEYVSGIIIVLHKKTAKVHSLGVKEGKFEYVRQGALAAIYYFSILWAEKNGYKWLDFGESSSFLNDGVLRYKKKWSLEIERSKYFRSNYGLKICNFSSGVRNFLADNPFIYLDQNKLKSAIIAKQNHTMTAKEVRAIIKSNSLGGLDCLMIISFGGFTEQATAFFSGSSNHRIRLICTNEEIFLKNFPRLQHSMIKKLKTAFLTTGVGPVPCKTLEILRDSTDLRAVVFSRSERVKPRWRELHEYGVWYAIQYLASGIHYILSRNLIFGSRVPEDAALKVWRRTEEQADVIRWMKDFGIDLVLVCGFQYILTGEMLEAFPQVINIHTSFLPNYRGPEPVIWGLLDGCREFGLTIHIMDAGIDSGDIICQASIDKPPFPLASAVEHKLVHVLPSLLHDTLQQIEKDSLSSTPQKEGFYLSVPTLKNRKKRARAMRVNRHMDSG